MYREWISTSEHQTEFIASQWAESLEPGTVVLLTGDLGAGKTCFSRGFLEGRGGNSHEVSSPSFSLVNEYYCPEGHIYHWDLYRLEAEVDWSVLDLEDHLRDSSAFTLIEWPERHPDLNPDRYTQVRIESTGESERRIVIFAE